MFKLNSYITDTRPNLDDTAGQKYTYSFAYVAGVITHWLQQMKKYK